MNFKITYKLLKLIYFTLGMLRFYAVKFNKSFH